MITDLLVNSLPISKDATFSSESINGTKTSGAARKGSDTKPFESLPELLETQRTFLWSLYGKCHGDGNRKLTTRRLVTPMPKYPQTPNKIPNGEF
jgi:hypothetical protein